MAHGVFICLVNV